MPIKVNIKMKDPKFKGDEPSFNVTVSGPTEIFGAKLRRTLELNGLSPYIENEGSSVWTAPYNIGGPSYYLAHLLAHKYGAEIHRNCRQAATDVVSRRKLEDGLDHILGTQGVVPAGRLPLKVIASTMDFAVNCDADDEERQTFLRSAGWVPIKNLNERLVDRLGTAPYRTRDPFIAANLEPFMSKEALRLLGRKIKEARVAISESKTQSADGSIDVPVPEGLSYLPFQQKGISIAIRSPGGAIIADDMGLGKTMQGIGVINASPEARRILVICQANMRIKWGREIEKWKVDEELTVGVAESSKFPDTDVCVINYDILQKNIEALRSREWDIIICDEAHNMKNPEAQRTKAVLGDLLEEEGERGLRLSKVGKLVHLTGTPKPNRIEELWPLISSTRPDLWGSGPKDFEIFKNRYCPPILIKKKMGPPGRQRDVIIPMNGRPIRETELQVRLRGSGSFVRRMKRDNPDLPPKFRTPLEIPVRLTKDEKELLRTAEADLEALMERISRAGMAVGDTQEAGTVINAISRMDPDTPHFSEMARVRRNLGMVKAPHCAKFIVDEILEEKDFAPENRTKTVVFAHHKDVIKVIHEEAEKRMKGAFLVYDGSITSAKKKQEIVDRFQNDDEIRGIIISLSGNTGITLTAAARMRVVEPDWSPSNMVQIEDRIWRIGQEMNVDIGYMSIAGTLDARIGDAIASKMETDEKTINTIGFEHGHHKVCETPSQKMYPDDRRERVSAELEESAMGTEEGMQDAPAQASLPFMD